MIHYCVLPYYVLQKDVHDLPYMSGCFVNVIATQESGL